MAKTFQIAILMASFLGLLGGPAAFAAESSRDTIEEVEVQGVQAFSSEEIQNAVEIEPGDLFEPARIRKAKDSLATFYHLRGYELAQVQVQFSNQTLALIVNEGEPTKVRNLNFLSDSPIIPSFEKEWLRIQKILISKFPLKTGDLYDQDRVSTGRKLVQEILASEDFVGGRISEVNADVVSPRVVDLKIHIDFGDRVSFGFQGNSVLTFSQLNALIEDQRQVGFGKDYLQAIRSRIIDEYRAQGYSQVTVETYTFEPNSSGVSKRHVTYKITEGPRTFLEKIQFDGNLIFTSEQLKEKFFEKASVILQTGYYVEKDVQSAAELLIEWIKSQGYLAAKLVTIDTTVIPQPKYQLDRSRVSVIVYLYEGEQTIVHGVSFSGLHAMTEVEARKLLQTEPEQPLNLFAFGDGLEALKAAYRARGYLGVKILNENTDQVIHYTQENRSADVNLSLEEGPEFRTSQILIEGLTQTRVKVVKRQLTIKEGEVLKETDLIESDKNIRRLGIFSSVNLRVSDDPNRPGYKVVRVILQEGTPGIIAGGVGGRNDLGVRIFGQVGYDDLWGANHTAALTLNANRRLSDYRFPEYQAQASYIWPWFLLDEVTARPVLTVSQSQYLTFDANSRSAAITLDRPLFKNPQITVLATYSLEGINQFNAQNPIDDQHLIIGSITPALRLDTRDSPLTPTTGWFSSASFEVASPYLLSETKFGDGNVYPVGYTRFQYRLDRFFSFHDITLYMSGRFGFERNTQIPDNADPRAGAIPLIKQFTMGGISSLRGWDEQEINYYSKSIQGALGYSNYRTQIDFPFSGNLRIGPFLDAGNLTLDSFSFGALQYGTGLGLHYQTPVGPVNLDWGFKVGEDQHRFYFSIGII